jgi:hypothetical protein
MVHGLGLLSPSGWASPRAVFPTMTSGEPTAASPDSWKKYLNGLARRGLYFKKVFFGVEKFFDENFRLYKTGDHINKRQQQYALEERQLHTVLLWVYNYVYKKQCPSN